MKKMRIFLFLFIFLILFQLSIEFRFQKVSRRLEEFEIVNRTGVYAPQGIAMCAGNWAILDTKSIIYQVRNIWNSSLPIAIAHCHELSDNQISSFQSEKDIVFVNVCGNELGIPLEGLNLQGRLQSWYCKAASLLAAPFYEVIVMDLDVVWFKKPDVLFSYKQYRESGALFFRDRFFHTPKLERQKKGEQTFHQLALALLKEHISVFPNASIDHNSSSLFTKEFAKSQIDKNGVVYFWRSLANPEVDPELDNYQDSSVVVLDRRKHPIFMKTLAKLIPGFNVGWGDKEMYWLAGIISQEPFTMEPFLTGNYGPCGFIIHYDPNDQVIVESPGYNSTITPLAPLYANAEWFIEKFQSIGGDLVDSYSQPVLATPDMNIWHIGPKGCGCVHMGCQDMTEQTAFMNHLLLRAQWERKTRSLPRYSSEDWPKLIVSRHIPRSIHYQSRLQQQAPQTLQQQQFGHNSTKNHHNKHHLPSFPGIYRNVTIIDTVNKKSNTTTSHIIALPAAIIVDIFESLKKVCIPIAAVRLKEIIELNSFFMTNNLCWKYGCGYLPSFEEFPLIEDEKKPNELIHKLPEIFCLPISFENIPPKKLRLLSILLLYPIPIFSLNLEEGTPVKTRFSKAVYLFQNQSLHVFPNGETFLKLGFQWNNIMVVTPQFMKFVPIGDPLPSME